MRVRRAEVLAGVAALLVCVASFVRGRFSLTTAPSGVLHPYLHVCIFAVIAGIAVCSTPSVPRRILLCVVVVLFGCFSEWIEWYWNGLAFEWADVVLDSMGAAAGTALGALLMEFVR